MEKTLCSFVYCVALMGCGVGSFRNETTTPTSKVESRSSIGFFGGSSETTIASTGSRYQVCMKEHDGNPSAARLCECQDWGVAPGSFPGVYAMGYGYYPPGFAGYQAYCSPPVFVKTP